MNQTEDENINHLPKRILLFVVGAIWVSLFWTVEMHKESLEFIKLKASLEEDARISNTFNTKYKYIRFKIKCNDSTSRKIELKSVLGIDNISKFRRLLVKGSNVEFEIESKDRNECSQTVQAYSLRINGKDYYTISEYIENNTLKVFFKYAFLILGILLMIYSILHKTLSKYEGIIENFVFALAIFVFILIYYLQRE